MEQVGFVKGGEYFLITSGDYSSYSVNALMRAIKDIELNDAGASYRKNNPDKCSKWYLDTYGFIAQLIAEGLAEELNYLEYRTD